MSSIIFESDEAAIGALALFLLFLLLAGIILSTHYNNAVVPRQMAEKGYCWQWVEANNSGHGQFTYVPCQPKQEK